jgi:hypothetical protein
MKSSNFCQPFARLFEANLNWAKVLSRAAVVAALSLLLPAAARAQTQLLVNPDWANGTNGWSVINNAIGNCTTGTSSQTYYNSTNGECPQDPTAQSVNVLTGTQCGKIYGAFNASPNTSEFFQAFPAAPGSTWSAGGFGYSSHEDLMGGNNFWYEVDFYGGTNATGTLLAAYESFIVEDLTCAETNPFPVDTWVGLPVTNQVQVTSGTNTGTVVGSIFPSGLIIAPAGAASVAFRAVYVNINYDGGSIYLDNAALTQLSATATPGPLAPTNVIATLGDSTNANEVLVSFYQNDTTATGYNVWRATNLSGPYTEIATNGAGTIETFYTGTNDVMFGDPTAVPGPTAYFYQVQAVGANGASAASSPAEVLFGQGNVLIDAGFEDPQTATGTGVVGAGVIVGWGDVIGDSDDAYGFLNDSGNTYCNGCNGTTTCPHDASAQGVLIHTGAQCAKVWTVVGAAPYTANGLGLFEQSVSSPGGKWAAGGWTLDSHEDLIAGVSFNFEVDFFDSGSNLLAAYESFLITNPACGQTTPYPVDTWVYLAVTNVMQVTNGTNTGVVITNTGPLGLMIAPHNTASVSFQATAVGTGSGSTFFDDCVLDAVEAPVLSLPTITGLTPDILFSTNTSISCTVNSSDSQIANVQAIVTTSPLGGTATTVTNTVGSAGLTVVGLNTAAANVSLALKTNLLYQVTFIGTDGNNLFTEAKASFDTLSPTLVIEAGDFNFNGGSFLDTPANGGLGLFENAVGIGGVDYNWPARNVNAPTANTYRPGETLVTIEQANPGNGTEQKFVNVAAAIANGTDTNTWDVPQEIGYDGVGDWMNYTRSYGSSSTNSASAGLYNVYADLANVGTAAVALYQITGDIASSDQTSNLLGSFTVTDNGWNTYDYTPLLDAYGNLVSVDLSGTETLRAEVSVNGPNIALFFLVPSAGQGPSVTSVFPTGLQPYEPTNTFTFTLGPGFTPSGASTISSNGVVVTLNGVNVSSTVNFSGSSSNLTGSLPITQQNIYTAVITATNAAGFVSTSTVVFNNFDPSDYSLDFSDYDFSTNTGTGWVSGLFIDDAVPSADSFGAVLAPPNYSGTIATNSYFYYPTGFTPGAAAGGVNGTPTIDPLGIGAIARQGVDIDFPDNGQAGANPPNIYYRDDYNPNVGNNSYVGLYPSDDTTDGFRTKYLNAQTFYNDPNIGSFQIGYFGDGNWLNYTRTFPTGSFYVWGRFAGDGGPISNTLSQVTSGVGTSNQTLELLGNFSGPQTGNYATFAWYPLRDANGNMVNLTLGGKETLRLTQETSPENAIFLMLVPAPVQLQLTASLVAGQINISFPSQSGFTYTVWQASTLAVPTAWTPVGATIPGTGGVVNVAETLTSTQGYYKVTGAQ